MAIKDLFSLLIFTLLCLSYSSNAVNDIYSGHVVNVEDFGAENGENCENEAFEKAWKETCASHSPTVLLVPENKRYILKPIGFNGPCKSKVTVMIKGTLEASQNPSDWDHAKNSEGRAWIRFRKVKNLVVTGGGTLNGNGEMWWRKSCKVTKEEPCTEAPTALSFEKCKDLRVEDLQTVDAQQMHIVFQHCHRVEVSRVTITAPESSPNTDGIHVTETRDIKIADSIVRTGDDCVSIVSGSRHVSVRNMICGPGHGISIGSLGAKNSAGRVSGVLVNDAVLTGTTNGVRIKTWQGGRGQAKNITFQNIVMNGVHNPIIIDQNYCDSKIPCHEQKSAVAVSKVLYKNIKGTSATKVAVTLNCSKSIPCTGITLQDIALNGDDGALIQSSCNNVRLVEVGKINPSCTTLC